MDQLDTLLAAQQDYYRRRAPLHDFKTDRYDDPVRDAIIERMRGCGALTGRVLELASGTGHYTAPLSTIATHVDAYDGAPEMLAILASRLLPNVATKCVDLFRWQPTDQWDAIFFNNWLAHVPAPRLEAFWAAVGQALKPGGRVVFVDVTIVEAWNEPRVFERQGVDYVERSVAGRVYDIVKHFWDPGDLMPRLEAMGWTGTATALGKGRGFVFYNLGRVQ